MSELADLFASIGQYQTAQREHAMIYQAALKERAAEYNGLPLDAYYHLPFAQWEVIREAYANRPALEG
jgi:hypothetical protein